LRPITHAPVVASAVPARADGFSITNNNVLIVIMIIIIIII